MKFNKIIVVVLVAIVTFFIAFLPTKAEVIKYIYGSAAGNLAINNSYTSYSSIGSIPMGAMFKITDTTKYGSLCSGMYKVTYNDITGYVCSSTTKIISIDTSVIDLNFKNNVLIKFPVEYHEKLNYLHQIYPNATFEPLTTSIDLDYMANQQTGYPNYSNKSLINITISSTPTKYGWINQASKISEGVYNNNLSGGGVNWYAASKEIVSYYIDPRNFLNDTFIFMFEKLSYDASAHTLDGVQSIIKGTFMEKEKIINDQGTEISYAEAFMTIGYETNVSPYHLASRVVQELGSINSSADSKMISGTVSGFEGYYNFYNICANGSDVVANALTCAQGGADKSQTSYGRPWNTRYRALKGGAMFISSDYINSGQDTLYSQKWDIVGDLFSHQYMQNIQAPVAETATSYVSAISKMSNYKTMPFVFKIPIYTNMGTSTALPNQKITASNDNGQTNVSNPIVPIINYGDVNGDGGITVLDLLIIQKYLLGNRSLSDTEFKASDVSKDGIVTILDLLKVQKHLLGVSSI